MDEHELGKWQDWLPLPPLPPLPAPPSLPPLPPRVDPAPGGLRRPGRPQIELIQHRLVEVNLAKATAKHKIMLDLLNELTDSGVVGRDHLGPAWEVLQSAPPDADALEIARRLWDANTADDRNDTTLIGRKTIVTSKIELLDREVTDEDAQDEPEHNALDQMVGTLHTATGMVLIEPVVGMLDSTLSAVVVARESAATTGRPITDPLRTFRRRAANGAKIILTMLRDEFGLSLPQATATLRVTIGSDTLDGGLEGASSALLSSMLHLPVNDKIATAWGIALDTAEYGDADKTRQQKLKRKILRHRKTHGPRGEQLELPVDNDERRLEIGYDGPESPPENRSA